MDGTNLLVVNHDVATNCGVREYGECLARALDADLLETNDPSSIECAANLYELVLLNHFETVTPWIRPLAKRLDNSVAVIHDPKQSGGFERWVSVDPRPQHGGALANLPRPVSDFREWKPVDELHFISFGFCFPEKGFLRAADVIEAEYFEDGPAYTIFSSMPHFAGVRGGRRAYNVLVKSLEDFSETVKVKIFDGFLPRRKLIDELSRCTAALLLYDLETEYRGPASTVDLAVEAGCPLLVSESNMFSHLELTPEFPRWPGTTLKQCVEYGNAPILALRDAWNPDRLKAAVAAVLEKMR
jgi:hypothetical protein